MSCVHYVDRDDAWCCACVKTALQREELAREEVCRQRSAANDRLREWETRAHDYQQERDAYMRSYDEACAARNAAESAAAALRERVEEIARLAARVEEPCRCCDLDDDHAICICTERTDRVNALAAAALRAALGER